MPKRFLTYSRTEPARTILWAAALCTIVLQALTLLPFFAGLQALPNVLLVVAVGGWAFWASTVNNLKQMSMSSFWLFMIWLFSGLMRLAVTSPDWTLMLWGPMLTVAVGLSVVYLYLSHQRRVGGNE